MILLGSIYFVFGIYLIHRCISSFMGKAIDTMFVIDISMLVMYVFPYICKCFPVILDTENYIIVKPTWIGLLCVLTWYVSFRFGRCFKIRTKLSSDNTQRGYYIKNEKQTILILSNIILVISLIAFVWRSNLYGGVLYVLKNITSIRYGQIQISNGVYAFLDKLYMCAPLAPVLMAGYWKNSSILFRINTIFAFIVSTVIILSTGGKSVLLMFAMYFVLPFYMSGKPIINNSHRLIMDKKNKKIIRGMVIFFAFFILILLTYRPFLMYMEDVANGNKAEAMTKLNNALFTKQGRYSIRSLKDMFFSFYISFMSSTNSLEMSILKVNSGEHSMNFLFEWIITLQAVLPSLLLGINKLQGLTDYNSAYLSGLYYNGVNVPPGIIAFSFYSGHIIFVILYGVLFAQIGIKIEQFNNRIKDSFVFSKYYYIFSIILYYNVVMGGDFNSSFRYNFTTFIFIIILHMCIRKRRYGFSMEYYRNENTSSLQ